MSAALIKMIRVKGYILLVTMLLFSKTALAYKQISLSSYSYKMTQTAQKGNEVNICIPHIAHTERKYGIPSQLLSAIAQVESGRWNKHSKRIEPWPWAVQVQGKGYFFPTKAEAVRAVRELLNKGITNIDVGCMQINIGHHGHAFQTLSQMFDPEHNIAYAGQFLKNLMSASSSWPHAVARYHSATPLYHEPYRKKVYEFWTKARHNNLIDQDDNILENQEGFSSFTLNQSQDETVDPKRAQAFRQPYGLVGARRFVISKSQKNPLKRGPGLQRIGVRENNRIFKGKRIQISSSSP